MIEKAFIDNWREKFATVNQPVLLAVSGGVDSMVLAHLLHQSQISFAIGHCNFQLRGADADGDQQFVKAWAEKQGIPFHTVSFDTRAAMQALGAGVQETARKLRYEWLLALCAANGYGALLTAHHANDNAETLLINLFKGTGISGLHGIPERNGVILRPLLFASRNEIAAYASAHAIGYREDASNASDKYLRNAVRHKVIPAVEAVFPDAVEQMNQSIRRFSQVEILYEKAIAAERKKLLEQRGRDYYVQALRLKHRQPLETICYELFRTFGFTASQTGQIVRLIESESGHYLQSGSHRIIKDRNFLIVTALQETEADLLLVEQFPATVDVANGKFSFRMVDTPSRLTADDTVAYVDADMLDMPLKIRRWKTGDYFYPFGMGMKKKKISRFLIDKKVPLHEKEQLWVLESNRRIVWLAGMRADERFKVKAGKSQVLKIEFRPL